MIIEIKAKFSCDDCGTEFFIKLDPAFNTKAEAWTLMDVAEDFISSSYFDSYEDGTDRDYEGYASIEGERHLCCRCTEKRFKGEVRW